jgi:MerR family transcriptional regulator, copper efflux regulator
MALTSGQLAKRAGVGVETLRFYEREGLLTKPARTASGYRQYPAEAIERVQFIRRAQMLGFLLKDIKELLALRGDPDARSGEVREKAVAKLADIDQKIKDLETMRDELTRLVAACDGTGPAAHCPIITAIVETPESESRSHEATCKPN